METPDHERVAWYEHRGLTVLKPAGSLDASLSPVLLRVANGHLRRGATKVALDLERTPMVTSLALSVMIQIHKSLAPKGGRLALFNVPTDVRETLAASRLDGLFELAGSADEAAQRLAD